MDDKKFQVIPTPIIIDNGSGVCKAGKADEDRPSCVFPNIIGRPRMENLISGSENPEFFIGDEAQAKRGVLSLSYPVDHGFVTS